MKDIQASKSLISGHGFDEPREELLKHVNIK